MCRHLWAAWALDQYEAMTMFATSQPLPNTQSAALWFALGTHGSAFGGSPADVGNRSLGRSRRTEPTGESDCEAIELKAALIRRQLEVCFDEQVDPQSTGSVRMCVSVYWLHPVMGRLPLSAFIDQVDRQGLLIEMADFVVAAVSHELRQWAGRGLRCPGPVVMDPTCLSNAKFSARVVNSLVRLSALHA